MTLALFRDLPHRRRPMATNPLPPFHRIGLCITTSSSSSSSSISIDAQARPVFAVTTDPI